MPRRARPVTGRPPLPRVERRLRAAVRALLGAVWLAVLLFAARALLW